MKNNNEIDFTSLGNTLFNEVIDMDFALFDDISKVPFFEYPVKTNTAVSAICLKGKLEISINIKHYTFGENQVVFIPPSQILQYHQTSDDFLGRFMVMSQNFLKLLQERIMR